MNVYDVHVVDGVPVKFSAQTMLTVEALKLGCGVRRTSRIDLTLVAPGGTSVDILKSRPKRTPASAVRTARDKEATREILRGAGIPVANGRTFEAQDLSAASAYCASMGFPVVVKPNRGRQGRAVTSDIRDEMGLGAAWERILASEYADGVVLVEEHVGGRDIRVFATRSAALSAIERTPAAVVGDGVSSIAQLAEAQNAQRQFNPYFMSKPVQPHGEPDLLRAQGVSPYTTPPSGVRVAISSVANISRGGESTDVTDQVHPTVMAVAVDAVRAIPGLEYAGVDLILTDPSQPLDAQRAVVIEVNGTPDIMMHPFPAHGTPRNVPAEIVLSLLGLSAGGLSKPSGQGAVSITIDGEVTGVGYRKWLQRRAEELDLVCECDNVGDRVVATVTGRYERVGLLVTRCARGPKAASVRSVEAWPAVEGRRQRLGPGGPTSQSSVARRVARKVRRSAASVRRRSAVRPDGEPSILASSACQDVSRAVSPDPDNRDIVEYISSLNYSKLPSDVVARAKLLILDTIGTMIVGSSSPESESIARASLALTSGDEATMIGRGSRCSSPGAAFANAYFAQVHDFSDGHMMAAANGGSSHPGRVVVPAALAEGERASVSGEELLTAIVIGYDVACKIVAAKLIDGVKIQPSSFYAAAAVTARLRGFDQDTTASAMGLAGYAAPSQHSRSVSGASTNALLNAYRAKVGVEAAILAGSGKRGPYIKDDVDRSTRFFERGLGQQFEVLRTYIKPYPSCRMTHSPVDATLHLVKVHDLMPTDIEAIHVEQLPRGMYVARKVPRSLRSHKKAQFSLHYCVARAAIDRQLTLSQFGPEAISDPQVLALMERITVSKNKSLGANFPERARPAIVTIRTVHGAEHTQRVDVPYGDPDNFPTEAAIREKFVRNARHVFTEGHANRLAELVMQLEDLEDCRKLAALL